MRNIKYSPATTAAIAAMEAAAKAADDAQRKNKNISGEGGLLDAAEKAVKMVNERIMSDALADLRAMPKADMFLSYMQDWAVPAFKLSTKTGVTVSAMGNNDSPIMERISFNALDKACGLARAVPCNERGESANWRYYIALFVNNCVLNWCAAHGEATVRPLPEPIQNFQVSLSLPWIDAKGKPCTGVDALSQQFNAIVAAIAPAEYAAACKMRGADCRRVQTAALVYKRAKANGKAEFRLPNLDALEEMVFDAIYDRANDRKLAIADSYARTEKVGKPGNGDKPAEGETAPKSGKKADKKAAPAADVVAKPATDTAAK